MAQRDLPFPESPSRRGVCRECAGPTKYIGKIKGGSIRRCDHCGIRQGESHCELRQTSVDSQQPKKKRPEVGASGRIGDSVVSCNRSMGAKHLVDEGALHDQQ